MKTTLRKFSGWWDALLITFCTKIACAKHKTKTMLSGLLKCGKVRNLDATPAVNIEDELIIPYPNMWTKTTLNDTPMSLTIKRTEILQILALKNQYKSYLEIGVQNPDTNFNRIPIDDKISVEPEPNAKATCCMTSDAFFAKNDRKFDLIFIDGLNEHQQVIRDIENAIKCLNAGGTIVVHDNNPHTKEMQIVPILPNQIQWTGDGWKAWIALRRKITNFSFKTIDTDYGVGIIRSGHNNLLQLSDDSITYEGLEKNRISWLNLISTQQFLNEEYPGENIWDDFIVASVVNDDEDFGKYLAPTVSRMGNYSIVYRRGTKNTCLAKEYNNVLKTVKQRFVLFVHPDFEFSPDFLIFANYIYDQNSIGAIGIYGIDFDRKYTWGGGRPDKSPIPAYARVISDLSCEVASLDSACILVDQNHGLFFDEQTFDDLHCHVEDYCFQQRSLGRKIVVCKVSNCKHYGTTTNKRQYGCSWGKYSLYHERLLQKWQGKLDNLITG